MEAQRRRASGKTVLGRALQYALGRWEALTRYADDGRLAIDNNVAERLMRGIAVSRNYAQRRIMRSPGWDGRQFSSDRLPNCA